MKKRRGHADPGFSRKSRTQSRPKFERFEDRLLMTVFTVTNTADSANAVAGDGSLRGEILASNASATALPNIIDFNLPSGLQTITAVAPMPTIVEPVTIDGSTATGFTRAPLIEISGNAQTAGPAFSTNASGVVFQDLCIDKFLGDAIDLGGPGSDTVAGCYIGVNPAGTAVASNSGTGILVTSPGNAIGSNSNVSNSPNVNVISGNNQGIQITGSGATNNVVSNNFIGTDATGRVALGNTNYGLVVNTSSNVIGSTIVSIGNSPGQGSGNLISGNLGGIQISGTSANNNRVQGNFVGTDVTGLGALPNKNDGIDVVGSGQNSIGGTSTGAGNVISGNGAIGIQVSGTGSTFNLIQGNLIGVGFDGTTPVGNANSGVVINGANFNYVGGTSGQGYSPQFGNTIEFNGTNAQTNYGVEILGGQGDAILSNSIFGNGGLGIKLNAGNAGIAPPTLTLAESGAGQSKIVGTYSGTPNETYGLQFFSSQAQNSSGSGDGKNYIGDYTFTTNSSGLANFSVLLNQSIPVGYYVSATITDNPTIVNNTSQFSANVQDIQAPVTDLKVSTTTSPTVPLYDQPYTYTITVTNGGQNDDTGVVLTDTLPSTATYVSSSAGTVSNGVLTDNIGNLANGASVVVTITVKPNTVNASFTNVATVTGDGLDPNPNNNTSTTTGTVVADSDVAVLISTDATLVPVGSPITYVVTVSNYGPSVANGTVATISLPSSFSAVTVSPDQGTYTIDGSNNIVVNTGLLGVSQSSTITITATPVNTGPAKTTATVTSTLADPNTANNTATSTVTVANAADLAITASANAPTVLVGGELVYTLVVSNNGPSPATEPFVTDVLPAGVSYDPSNSSAGPNGTLSFNPTSNTVTANFSPLLAGDTDTLTIAVVPSVPGPLTNPVSVYDPTQANSQEIDTNLSNNTATVSTLVSPIDLSVVVNNPIDPLFIGNQEVYSIVVTNAGPADATNVAFSDVLGSLGSILGTSVGTINGNTVSANLGTIASGASVTINITVDPISSGVLTDTASASTTDEYDTNPTNNSQSVSNLVSPVDLGLTVTPSSSSLLIGQPLTYTITVTNSGPATATNVIFNDVLPSNASVDSYTTSQGSLSVSSAVLSGNLGSIASGGSVTIAIIVTPNAVESAVNTASITSDDYDTNPSNNSVVTTVGTFNLPGTIQFPTTVSTVPENGGSITLTVERTDGTLGAVAINYATSDYSAIAGINYVATSGVLNFADGQTTATITVPVLDDQIINGSHVFFVTLSNPTNGALIGTNTATAVVVTNTDRDTIPPVVSSLIGIPNGGSLNGFIVTFDKAMNLGPISDLSNYHVFTIGANGSQTLVPLAGVQYNLATNALTIVPTAPLPGNRFYRVVLNGAYGDVLTDVSGNILYGSSGPNTNYDVVYGQGTNLTYDDASGNAVNIKLTGGGTLGIFLASNGNAEAVNLYSIVPGKSRISGSVKKLGKHSSGYTTIGFINGFGEFGNVYSNLTTPAFYVGSAPVSISSAAASPINDTVNALSTTTKKVTKTITLKSKTPRAPKVELA